MVLLPPLRAIGRVRVEIYGALPGSAKWDEAVWGASTWAIFGWMDITPQSMAARVTWGADDPTGVLTIPAAGAWVINTYDPKRLLDPSNGQSPYATSLRPGKPIRLSYIDAGSVRRIVRQGLIDEILYDISEKRGTLRGTDMVQLMVNAIIPAATTGIPNTLRARASYLINKAGLGVLVPVQIVDELIVNGTFEQGFYGWPTVVGGTSIGAGYRGNGVIIKGDGGYPQIQNANFQVYAGRQYKLSAWGKINSFGSAGICRLDSSAGVTQAFVNFGVADSNWVYKEVNWTPASDMMVHILAFNEAGPIGTTVAFDSISFGEILPDPPVGPAIATEASLWTHILTAALDALSAAWLDRSGMLRFRSFGNPSDTGFQAGGSDGIPVSTLRTQGSLQGVYTHVIAFASAAPTVPVSASDATKMSLYGDIVLKRDAPVPDAATWVASVLADRSGSSLQYEPGTLYPQTEPDLESILDLGMVDIAHLVVESVSPTVDVAARVLGGSIIADTGTGWTAELSTYIPATEWDEAEQPEPPVVIPPPSTTQVVRTYACTKDARLAHSSSVDAGNGLDTNIPIGYISPYRNRGVFGFASIPFAGVVSVDKAELLVTIGANSCGAFGSSPKVQVSRLTGSFSEGSYNVDCGFSSGNSVKYPGPSTTGTGAVTKAVSKTTGTQVSIDITEIARAWLAGQPQNGLMVKSSGEDSGTYTTCFYARHHGTVGNRPSLKLTLTVQA